MNTYALGIYKGSIEDKSNIIFGGLTFDLNQTMYMQDKLQTATTTKERKQKKRQIKTGYKDVEEE